MKAGESIFVAYVPVFAAGLSAIISFIVAWFTGARAGRLEANKVRLATQQAAFAKLQEARIREYPRLYALLSDLQKALDQPSTVSVSLYELLRNINEWDSQCAVFLGRHAVLKCHAFRMILVNAVRSMEVDTPQAITIELCDAADALELALRTDLGIYGVEFDHTETLSPPRPTDWD
jgi:hypothetical protein